MLWLHGSAGCVFSIVSRGTNTNVVHKAGTISRPFGLRYTKSMRISTKTHRAQLFMWDLPLRATLSVIQGLVSTFPRGTFIHPGQTPSKPECPLSETHACGSPRGLDEWNSWDLGESVCERHWPTCYWYLERETKNRSMSTGTVTTPL